MGSYAALFIVFALVLPGVQSNFNFPFVSGLYLNWSSFYPNGTVTGEAGRVQFDLGTAGPNGPDESGTGGMTRRLVLATPSGSCTELCEEPQLSNQACTTSTERGQMPHVPLKDAILLYVSPGGVDTHGTTCNSYTRPYNDDFLERSGAAGMLHMWEANVHQISGRHG
jgi:hypothetical protein